MEKTYLYEAFKQLSVLNEEDFNLSETDGIEELTAFDPVGEKEIEKAVDIIDPEAAEEEDLKDSYIGKVILDCNVCHSKIYKDKEDIKLSDEDETIVNVEDECPFCFSNDGYSIVGEVIPFSGLEEPKEEPEAEPAPIEEPVEAPVEAEEKEVEEALCEEEEKFPNPEKHEEVGEHNGVKMFHCNDCGKFAAMIDGKKVKKDSKEELEAAIDAKNESLTEENNDNFRYKETFDSEKEAEDAATKMNLVDFAIEPDEEGFALLYNIVNESLTEDVHEVEVKADGQKVEVKPDEDGKLTIEIEKCEGAECAESASDEVVGELTPETAEEIVANNMEDEIPVEPEEEEEIALDDAGIDYDIEDFDEDSFNEIGESYLKNVYENVETFTTSNVTANDNGLLVEGIIKFNSGKEKKTSFVFEADAATSTGKIRFNGLNEQISRGKKSFTLTGSLVENKFISESLKYNYRAKNAEGESTRIYGTVKKA